MSDPGAHRERTRGGERAMVPRARFEAADSYYGRSIVKSPVWKPQVAWYLFAGGLAGASAAQGLAADIAGNRKLARRSWLVALAGVTVSPGLLVTDLGRPERFLHMLRVLKVTSPMSVGSWILATMGSATAIAAGSDVTGLAPRVGAAAKLSAGLLGLPLATYTGVLVANTAVPVWHEARRELPFAFAGGAAAAAGSAAALVTAGEHGRPARRLAVMGAAVESAALFRMERRLGELGRPYREGAAGRYARLAKGLAVAGGATVAASRGRRASTAAGALMLLAGSVSTRWAVYKAGFASARDPRYTVEPQRRRAAATQPIT